MTYTAETIRSLFALVDEYDKKGLSKEAAFRAFAVANPGYSKGSASGAYYMYKKKKEAQSKQAAKVKVMSADDILRAVQELVQRVNNQEIELERLRAVESEYMDLLSIMDKARKAAYAPETSVTSKYRMDNNGNLERM